MQRLPLWLAALWWSSLTTVGFLVVPLLFVHLPTPAMAGQMAARLFTAQTWVSVVCGVVLLMLSRSRTAPSPASAGQIATLFILLGVLLALLVEFAVAPRIVAKEDLRFWHSLGSLMYLGQWLCAAVTLWQLTPQREVQV
jgi:hypothetical protein